MKKFLMVLLLVTMGAGCTSTSITNLTPRELPRNSNHVYRFEAAWRSRQQTLRKETLQGFVVIGTDLYPMKPTPVVSNHWEAVVPLPPGQEVINYRYKFDFDYASVPQRRKDSKMSGPYQLRIAPQ